MTPFSAMFRDGYPPAGHLWTVDPAAERGTVIVNAATGSPR